MCAEMQQLIRNWSNLKLLTYCSTECFLEGIITESVDKAALPNTRVSDKYYLENALWGKF